MSTEFFEDFMEEEETHTSNELVAITPESQAREIYKSMGTEKLLEFLEKRDEYVCASSITIDDYINTTIVVLGMWIKHVPAGLDKLGVAYNDFDSLLVKVSDTDKNGTNIIIHFGGRQALQDAHDIWLPVWGWGDWEQPVKFLVKKSGQQIFFKAQR